MKEDRFGDAKVGLHRFSAVVVAQVDGILQKALARELVGIAESAFPLGDQKRQLSELIRKINFDIFSRIDGWEKQLELSQCQGWIYGKGDKKNAIIAYYWLHIFYPDRAERVDAVAFDTPLKPVLLAFDDDPAFNGDLPPELTDARRPPRSEAARLPLKGATQVDNPNHYSQNIIDVLGREKAEATLDAFLEDGVLPDFRWMQLAGEGGQGKSRLAWDLIRRAGRRDWQAGFLRADDLPALADRWTDWEPEDPALIAFDYVLGVERLIGDAMAALARRGHNLAHKVRFLLIERQDWSEGGLGPSPAPANGPGDAAGPLQLSPSDGAANWFRKLAPERGDLDLKDSAFRYDKGLLKLEALDDAALVDIVRKVSAEHKKTLELDDAAILKALKQADKHGRPLYAYFLARAMVADTYEPNWCQADFLDWALQHELEARWSKGFAKLDEHVGRPPEYGERHVSMLLALLATMVENIDARDLRENFIQPLLNDLPYPSAIRQAQIIAANPVDGGHGATQYLQGLAPDLLGEWFVLTAIRLGEDLKLLNSAAWEYAPIKYARFLVRVSSDFTEHTDTLRLFVEQPPIEAVDVYASFAADICINFGSKGIAPPAQVFELYIDQAGKGDPHALGILATNLKDQYIDRVDIDWLCSALKWSANNGSVHAIESMAISYMRGDIFPRSDIRAAALFRKTCRLGSTTAAGRLGFLIGSGALGRDSRHQCVPILEYGHRAGDALSKSLLANLLLQGAFVERDAAEGLKLHWSAYLLGVNESGAYAVTLALCSENYLAASLMNRKPLDSSIDALAKTLELHLRKFDLRPEDVRSCSKNIALAIMLLPDSTQRSNIASLPITRIESSKLGFYRDIWQAVIYFEGHSGLSLCLHALYNVRGATIFMDSDLTIDAIAALSLEIKTEHQALEYIDFYMMHGSGDLSHMKLLTEKRIEACISKKVMLETASNLISAPKFISNTAGGGYAFDAFYVTAGFAYRAVVFCDLDGKVSVGQSSESFRIDFPWTIRCLPLWFECGQ